MILQSLYEYYQRRADLPKPGFELKEFKFEIVLKEDGSFFELNSLLVDKKTGRFFLVPKGHARSGKNSWMITNLLWDHCGYVLGISQKAAKTDTETLEYQQMAQKQNQVFRNQLETLPEELKKVRGVHAILEFYRKNEQSKVPGHENWEKCFSFPGCNLLFRIKGDLDPVSSSPEVVKFVMEQASEEPSDDAGEGAPVGRCLITGERGRLTRLLSPTPIPGGKSNSSLVSFQKSSGYDSYGKEQCFNAPISTAAEFACTTALNRLLGKESRNKFLLGSTSAVFWTKNTEKEFSLEDVIPAIASLDKDSPDAKSESVQIMLRAAYTGKLPVEDAENVFYFLGLSPNAARICVRFWIVGTIGVLGKNLYQHFEDFSLIMNEKYRKPLTLYGILASLAPEGKLDKLASNFQTNLLEAVFKGTAYPVTLLHHSLGRIRAERRFYPFRIAAIKAYLNRKARLNKNTQNKEITMSLDLEYTNAAYLCGRLFAVLEKAQAEANPAVNASICDRFYGAASTTPIVAFSRLLALNNHHLDKLTPARRVYFRNLIGDIMEPLVHEFPAHLELEDQGRFAIGYYQQNHAFYEKKAPADSSAKTKTEKSE